MAPSSSHKPRAKRVKDSPEPETPLSRRSPVSPVALFPLASFLWPARGTSQWIVLPLILMAVGLFRWTTGLWSYSGFQTPPMHGDFEAQRHWMELTIGLPITQWYFHDLEWWGLDYPPLTAYHSWLLGKLGSFVDPAWFALYTSRGLDDALLKVYMRATVFISEYLVLVPAAVIFFRRLARQQGVSSWDSSIALVAFLMQPATILIDHGHFQYNTVMLGLVLASISTLTAQKYLWASVFFVAALGYKQMALYYAPAIFVYLLASCINPRPRPFRLISIALVTILSFAILFAPFWLGGLRNGPVRDEKKHIAPVPVPSFLHQSMLTAVGVNEESWYYPALQQTAQAIHRILPFARGIFEDKVANVWCALNVLVKLRQYPVALLQRLSLMATLATIIPPCTILFLRPRPVVLVYALAAVAWGFFLCSFQVHEKSVLLPLLPMTLVFGRSGGLSPSNRAWVGWANMLGVWTMFPLLQRDQLRVPYAVLSLLWAYLLGLPPVSFSAYSENRGAHADAQVNFATKAMHLLFYLCMGLWHIAEAFVVPPTGKPDLWVVVNVGVGAAGFGICYLWCVWQGLQASGLVSTVRQPVDSKKKSKGPLSGS